MSKALFLFRFQACARPRHRRGAATGAGPFPDTKPPLAESYIPAPEGGEATSRIAALAARLTPSTIKAGRRQGDRAVNSFRVTATARSRSERRRPAAALSATDPSSPPAHHLRRFGV
jgi:hypothetical protein